MGSGPGAGWPRSAQRLGKRPFGGRDTRSNATAGSGPSCEIATGGREARQPDNALRTPQPSTQTREITGFDRGARLDFDADDSTFRRHVAFVHPNN